MNAGAVLQRVVLRGTKYNDVFLAFAVVLIVALMIIPVPPEVLDVLLATNLTGSVILIVTSMYIPSVLSFSTFPSLLLFTTLFRLSLDVTATRQILLHAYAGSIINAFGNFVVAGNFVVGLVIFLIITIVQFIVVTKGAERVSEVSARFTLDAMPGKQMSIDADMRAGVIDVNEARRRRTVLEKENQLYGAMDGAMKFVKGDAIASIIVTAINILGGLAIGILQKGMPLEKALTTYSVLTIGDGLVSQIPSLLISITAAIIVTRVSSEESGGGLGGEIGRQLLGQPKALLIGAALLVLIGLVPGFPTPLFLLMALIFGALGYSMSQQKAEGEERPEPGMAPAMQQPEGAPKKRGTEEEFSVAVPLMIEISQDTEPVLPPAPFNTELARLRSALYRDLGVPFPGIRLRFTVGLPSGVYRVLLNEVPISSGKLLPGKLFVREKESNLEMIGIEFTKEKLFLPRMESIWVADSYREKLKSADISFFELPQILIFHLSFILKRYAGEFIGLQETKFLLSHLEEQLPEVVREVQRILPIQKIAEVLSRLVQEEISIRNLRTILESLIDWGQREKETVLLTEYVRSSLKRYISYKFSGGQNILPVYLFEPKVEETLRKSIRQTSAGSYLALDPGTSRKLVDAIKKQLGDLSQSKSRPALLTSMDVRRYLRKLVEAEFQDVPVLSYQELTEEITIQPLGRILL